MSEVEYTMKPIEVYYRGYKFRSRLEARWAAFFDLCKWRWEYEPTDFNGWFPDFVLLGKEGNKVYVEVKPIAEPCPELQDQIDQSGCPDEVLILGLCPTLLIEPSWPEYHRLGWIREDQYWAESVLIQSVPEMQSPFVMDFMHVEYSWRPRMLGRYSDNGEFEHPRRVDVSYLWGLAHEMTRYDPA